MKDEELLKAATELAKEINKVVDEHLPKKLASIVKLHAGLAVGSAFIPIPGADIAAEAANTWAMYVRINRELELPFGENAVKSLAAGVFTNIGSNVAGVLIIASAIKIFPGMGSLGGAALMGGTVYALTIAAGIVYMKAIAKLLRSKTAHEVSEADLKDAADHVLKDKAGIRAIVKDAKKSYKKGDEIQTHAEGNDDFIPPSSLTAQNDSGAAAHFAAVPEAPKPPSAGRAFLATGGKTYGPYPLGEVQQMRASGQLAKDTQYWREGMSGWIPIARLPASF
jgi:uncharacterized protein (DUF697 family)